MLLRQKEYCCVCIKLAIQLFHLHIIFCKALEYEDKIDEIVYLATSSNESYAVFTMKHILKANTIFCNCFLNSLVSIGAFVNAYKYKCISLNPNITE